MIAKPMKTLELRYPMIQFSINWLITDSYKRYESSLTRTFVVVMGHSTLYQYKTLYGVETNVDFQGSVNEDCALLIHEENGTSFLSNQLFSNENCACLKITIKFYFLTG